MIDSVELSAGLTTPQLAVEEKHPDQEMPSTSTPAGYPCIILPFFLYFFRSIRLTSAYGNAKSSAGFL